MRRGFGCFEAGLVLVRSSGYCGAFKIIFSDRPIIFRQRLARLVAAGTALSAFMYSPLILILGMFLSFINSVVREQPTMLLMWFTGACRHNGSSRASPCFS
jgi:hypothetical protein